MQDTTKQENSSITRCPQSPTSYSQSPVSYPLSSILKLVGLIILATTTFGCGNITPSGMSAIGANVTPISDLAPSSTPNQDNTTVYVQGKITQHVPLIEKHAYQLDDTTGKIWVLTNQSNLKIGSQIVMKGQLRYQSIPLSGKEFGELYLEEK